MRIDKRPTDAPVTLESGVVVTEEVDSVTWFDGNLPDEEYEDFGLSVKLPFPQQDGFKFYFPVIQKCMVGWNNWTDIPSAAAPSPRYPAPALSIFANGTLSKFNATQFATLNNAPKSNDAASIDLSGLLIGVFAYAFM